MQDSVIERTGEEIRLIVREELDAALNRIAERTSLIGTIAVTEVKAYDGSFNGCVGYVAITAQAHLNGGSECPVA